jgi:dUTP pyrophosphatase
MIDAPVTILPGEQKLIGTGIQLNMSRALVSDAEKHIRVAAIAIPRSGRGSKEGLCLANTVGLIDQDYTGEIMLCCWARPTNSHINITTARVGGAPIHIEPYERIAQLMIVPVFRPRMLIVDEFSDQTARGAGGFGSTGK